jgi:hypothetical protein
MPWKYLVLGTEFKSCHFACSSRDNRAAIELLLSCLEVFGTCDWDSQSQSNNFDKLFDPQRWELFLRYPNVKAFRAEHSLSA